MKYEEPRFEMVLLLNTGGVHALVVSDEDATVDGVEAEEGF